MRSIRKIVAIVTSFALASCVTAPAATPGASTGITFAEVKAAAITTCSYVPTLAEVTALIPQFAAASDIATAMCGVLKSVGARRGGAVPTLKGVPLKGHFVS